MTTQITTSSPRTVGSPKPFWNKNSDDVPHDFRDRNFIIGLFLVGIVFALIMIVLCSPRKHTVIQSAIVTATAPIYPTNFMIWRNDWPERHGVTHQQVLDMSRIHLMPFVSKQWGRSKTWVNSRDAQMMLVAHNRMILPVCYGDRMDFTPGVMIWKPAFGSTSLVERRRQIKSGRMYTCQ